MIFDFFNDLSNPQGYPEKIPIPNAEIYYFKGFFSQSESRLMLSQLREKIYWEQKRISSYGRVRDLPRLTAWYGDPDKTYSYSGITVHSRDWIPALWAIKRRIEIVSDCTFNSVLLNRYRSGSDSVSWHADDEPELGQNPVIGSVSFGEERLFQMKHKLLDKKCDILLENGSYFLMRGGTQEHWVHQIAKSKYELAERINLTFRKII